jgi:[ribosomal protein S18]-alanine N-acetyltransferase
MAMQIDKMTAEDVPEVMAIERDSFMTPWPSSAYRRELNENKNAHYLVLRRTPRPPRAVGRDSFGQSERRGFWSGFLPMHRSREIAPAPPDQQTLAGYAGLWLMIDEAHVTTIAVRPQFRGRGLGELMLVALTEIAIDINARWLTLEVRVSNEVAQALYRKYGFKPAGVRQRYYSDNHEDALIMWTDEIQAAEFQRQFTALRDNVRARLQTSGDIEADAGVYRAGGRPR